MHDQDIKITKMAKLENEEYEVKIHFERQGKEYFGILNLKSGDFVSNLVHISEQENQQVVHYLSHQAAHFLEEQGILLPDELKCGCNHKH